MFGVSKPSRRARWAIPIGALVVTGGVMAGSLISTAQAAPALPPRTPAQLLAEVAQAQSQALSGTVVQTASLGLPSLPGNQNPTSISSLLTGSHTIKVWCADAQHYRIAVPESLSETDLVRDGGTVWLWQSTLNRVTEIPVPAHRTTPKPALPPALPPSLTPQQAAQLVLAAVGPTTTVRVDSNVLVAGRAAYELVLAPKDARSLVGQVRIAIDGSNKVPLRVQVFARGAASPAISVGFTAVTFARPAAAETSFTPPAGAKIVKVTPEQGRHPGSAPEVSTTGSGWLTVLALPSSALTSGAPAQVPGHQENGDSAAVLRTLLASATAVRGDWGTGRLLHTSLINVLMTDSGRTFLGAVQPSVLYAAAKAASPS